MFPKFHGIQLALNSWIANAVVENLAADPAPLTAGRIWYNTTAKALKFSSLDSGGAVITEVVATGAAVQGALDALSALGARVTAIEGSYVKKDGSVAFTGDVDAGSHKVKNVANGTDNTDAVNFGQLQAAIGTLANAFAYKGTVAGGAEVEEAFDLNTLSAKGVGSYYKVATAGYFKVGAEGQEFYANLNDGLVFNDDDGVDIIDNTNSNVAGTAGFITVTGSADTGFTVDIAAAFKARLVAVEEGLAAEIARATAAESALDDKIDAEQTRAQTAEGVLTDALEDEVARATGAEAVLDGKITDEATRAQAAELALSNKVGDLSTLSTTAKTNLVSAVNEIAAKASGATGDLSTLTTDAKDTVVAAINEVDAHADAAQAAATAAAALATAEEARAKAAEGDLATLTTTAKGSLVAAINEVDANADAAKAAADAEKVRAEGVEGSLAALTTTAKGNLVAAINEVDANADAAAAAVAAETLRAQGAEEGLSDDIAAEQARALGVEGNLNNLTTTDKSNLVAAINEVAQAAGEGTGALKSAINAQRFKSTSATAALTHTFTHNLNSGDLQVSVWVKGDDDVFRNDIVAVELTSANVATVTLTEAKIVRIVIQKMDDLA